MSYKDNKFGQLFPTRTGTPSGAANERQMLDALGGSEGYRKRFQNNADGSVTRVDTKNGMPQFSTTGGVTTPVAPTPYLESGQLEWAFPSDTSPTKFDPAKWHFLNLPTSSNYLGYITGDTGAQDNFPALSESMDSQAIGYPKVRLTANSAAAEIYQAAITDAQNKQTYGPMTQRKKLTAGMFPPSLFSGKMRLFMQAQYGAKEKSTWPLTMETVGESTLLKYVVDSKSIQFGFWDSNTPGILTAADGTFWLIIVSHAGTTFSAMAYAIKPTAEVDAPVARYKAGGLVEAEKTQLEAYIFAHSDIDISNPRMVGSFTGPVGSPLAYGWKWNKAGTTASIVLHELSGTGASDYVWISHTVHITFTYDSGVLAMSGQASSDGSWTDGWGVYNIFVPTSDTGTTAPLIMRSLATHRAGVMPAFAFSGVAVYGYYKDDEWIVTRISRTMPSGTYPKYSQSDAGITYGADAAVTSPGRYARGILWSEGECSYESHNLTSDYTMDLAVGATTFNGKSEYGEHFYFTRTVPGGVFSGPPDAVDFTSNYATPMTYSMDMITPRGTPPSGVIGTSPERFTWQGVVRLDSWSHTGWKHHSWVLVIPAGDCEAVYAVTHEDDVSSSITHSWSGANGLMGFYGSASGGPYDMQTWTQANQIGSFFGVGGSPFSGSDGNKPAEAAPQVYCFNTAIAGTLGVSGGSYDTLFNVDYTYPYYGRCMYTCTSYGRRYIMSEGLKSPASVELRPFFGWA